MPEPEPCPDCKYVLNDKYSEYCPAHTPVERWEAEYYASEIKGDEENGKRKTTN